MIKYKRITYNERLKIEALYNICKYSICKIAIELGRSPSSICEELKHGYYMHLNSDYTTTKKYSADRAQQHSDFAITTKRPPLKIGNDYAFVKEVEKLITGDKKSPDEVVKILSDRTDIKTKVCTTTLYSYINQGLFPNLTNKDLFFKGKRKKRKRNKKVLLIPHGLSIEKRSETVNSRNDFGHWEMYSVIGNKKKSNTLIVLTERKTRYELIFRSKDKTSFSTVKVMNKLEKIYKQNFSKMFKTITVDNGVEFSDTAHLEQSIYGNRKRTLFYYCHPYSSYERGSNENQNRFIRQFIPKGTSINKVSDASILNIQNHINNKLRKIFNYRSSADLFFEELACL